MTGLALLLSTLAFALFGMATHDHYRRWRSGRITADRARQMRLVAWMSLVAALPLAIGAQGWVFGPILWVGSLMLGAALVFLALNLIPAPYENRK